MNQLLEKRLEEIVLANISDQNFDSAKLVREASVSRKVLNDHLRKRKYRNVRCFIKEIRLKKAKEMLLRNNLTAAEVAYMVGFSSPAYFNKCFHEYIGSTPGEIKNNSPEDYVDQEYSPEGGDIYETDNEIEKDEEAGTNGNRRLITVIIIMSGAIIIMTVLIFLLYFTDI